MKAIILLSGGIDSVTLLVSLMTKPLLNPYLNHLLNANLNANDTLELIPVIFDYGQKQFKAEKKSAESICSYFNLKLIVEQIGTLDATIDSYIPSRNSILIFHSAYLGEKFGAEIIYYGAIKTGDIFTDCTEDYVSKMNTVLNINNLKLVAPFINLTKKDVIKIAYSLDVDIASTWSCNFAESDIFGGIKTCGICGDCKTRDSYFKCVCV